MLRTTSMPTNLANKGKEQIPWKIQLSKMDRREIKKSSNLLSIKESVFVTKIL